MEYIGYRLYGWIKQKKKKTISIVKKKKIFHKINRSIYCTSFCLADVSRNDAFHCSAKRLPSSVDTARSWCKSVLLPTRTTGTLFFNEIEFLFFVFFEFWIVIFNWRYFVTHFGLPITSNNFSYMIWTTSNDSVLVMEYTKT